MAYDFNGTSFSTTTTPKGNLLIYDCLGCHTGTNDGTNTTPYVYDISEPTYGTNTLAGGNFYWVKTDDAKGHNVLGISGQDSLTEAPGNPNKCGNSCHYSLVNNSANAGCEGCHMVSTAGIHNPKKTAYHHNNDGTGTKYVSTYAQGYYRFLSGHYGGADGGVAGIEHEKWNYGATASSHNEYLGLHNWNDIPVGLGGDAGGTMTAFCCGCHGNFHIQSTAQVGASPWLRHPSDAVIPSTGEYASAFGGGGADSYDPNLPVARPSTFAGWATDTPSGTVTLGTDMVMCLSCHVGHGSPYDKMMRWNYRDWPGTIEPAGSKGCATCHTSKD